MNKLLIVDGHNLLFQMFFGMPSKIYNKDNKPIHGTLGFVGGIIKLINIINPTHVLVVFDSDTPNDRIALDENYKQNRIDYSLVPDEENPFTQLPDIYAALSYMRINYLEANNCEADDIIANYVYKYEEDFEIYISSFDSDFFQLVNENVKVVRYRGNKTIICDSNYIKEKYDVFPHQYACFKSLVGDNADNIKGVPSVGVKTASKLINLFDNLDNLIMNVDGITPERIKKSITENIDRLNINYQLIKLSMIDSLFEDEGFIIDIDKLKYEHDNSIQTNYVLSKIGLR